MTSDKRKPRGGEALTKLSTRKLQAIAALCLVQFCAVHRIRHSSIEQLVEHLMKMLINVDLAMWEREGACLELSGRGDPLPRSLEAILPQSMVCVFPLLVDKVVEVGIVDMYGQRTGAPIRFLSECIKTLVDADVKPPVVDNLFEVNTTDSENEGFGLPLSQADYERALRKCQTIWSEA